MCDTLRELRANPDGVRELIEFLRSDTSTFLYSSKEQEINNAVALGDFLKFMLRTH